MEAEKMGTGLMMDCSAWHKASEFLMVEQMLETLGMKHGCIQLIPADWPFGQWIVGVPDFKGTAYNGQGVRNAVRAAYDDLEGE